MSEADRLLRRLAWDAAHLRTVGTKLNVEDFTRLVEHCERQRMSRYELLRRLIMEELARSS